MAIDHSAGLPAGSRLRNPYAVHQDLRGPRMSSVAAGAVVLTGTAWLLAVGVGTASADGAVGTDCGSPSSSDTAAPVGADEDGVPLDPATAPADRATASTSAIHDEQGAPGAEGCGEPGLDATGGPDSWPADEESAADAPAADAPGADAPGDDPAELLGLAVDADRPVAVPLTHGDLTDVADPNRLLDPVAAEPLQIAAAAPAEPAPTTPDQPLLRRQEPRRHAPLPDGRRGVVVDVQRLVGTGDPRDTTGSLVTLWDPRTGDRYVSVQPTVARSGRVFIPELSDERVGFNPTGGTAAVYRLGTNDTGRINSRTPVSRLSVPATAGPGVAPSSGPEARSPVAVPGPPRGGASGTGTGRTHPPTDGGSTAAVPATPSRVDEAGRTPGGVPSGTGASPAAPGSAPGSDWLADFARVGPDFNVFNAEAWTPTADTVVFTGLGAVGSSYVYSRINQQNAAAAGRSLPFPAALRMQLPSQGLSVFRDLALLGINNQTIMEDPLADVLAKGTIGSAVAVGSQEFSRRVLNPAANALVTGQRSDRLMRYLQTGDPRLLRGLDLTTRPDFRFDSPLSNRAFVGLNFGVPFAKLGARAALHAAGQSDVPGLRGIDKNYWANLAVDAGAVGGGICVPVMLAIRKPLWDTCAILAGQAAVANVITDPPKGVTLGPMAEALAQTCTDDNWAVGLMAQLVCHLGEKAVPPRTPPSAPPLAVSRVVVTEEPLPGQAAATRAPALRPGSQYALCGSGTPDGCIDPTTLRDVDRDGVADNAGVLRDAVVEPRLGEDTGSVVAAGPGIPAARASSTPFGSGSPVSGSPVLVGGPVSRGVEPSRGPVPQPVSGGGPVSAAVEPSQGWIPQPVWDFLMGPVSMTRSSDGSYRAAGGVPFTPSSYVGVYDESGALVSAERGTPPARVNTGQYLDPRTGAAVAVAAAAPALVPRILGASGSLTGGSGVLGVGALGAVVPPPGQGAWDRVVEGAGQVERQVREALGVVPSLAGAGSLRVGDGTPEGSAAANRYNREELGIRTNFVGNLQPARSESGSGSGYAGASGTVEASPGAAAAPQERTAATGGGASDPPAAAEPVRRSVEEPARQETAAAGQDTAGSFVQQVQETASEFGRNVQNTVAQGWAAAQSGWQNLTGGSN